MAANRELSQLGDVITVDSNGHIGIGTTTPPDSSWNDSTHGNKEVAIDGGTGYSVLHFRGEGSNGTETRFSTGVGDGKYWLAYDDVGGEHRIVVDANNNGNVGIGTSNPINRFMVDGGADYNMGLRSASSRSGLVIYPPGTSTTPAASALVLASDNTYRLGTQSYYNIIMDQTGRVTMPQQPYAFVDFGGPASYVSMSGTAPFDNIVESQGNDYSTSTYRFTCPVAGVYQMSAGLLSQSSSDQYHVEFHKNGTRVSRNYTTYRANQSSMSVKAAAGDYLTVVLDTLNYYQGTAGDRYCWATYMLVG